MKQNYNIDKNLTFVKQKKEKDAHCKSNILKHIQIIMQMVIIWQVLQPLTHSY